jgi:ribonuclease toxin BrnT of type II toxin-antitoxin system
MPRASGAVLSRDTGHRAQIVDYMHNCAYTVRSMADDAEWDPRKAAANLKNHGVDFADAATVLHDEQAITTKGTRSATSQSA